MDDGFINKDLNFPDNFLLISLDEVWSIDVNLFRYLSGKFFLDLKFNLNQLLLDISNNNRLISVLCELNNLYLWLFNLYRYFWYNFYRVLIFDYNRYCFLDLYQFCLVNNMRNFDFYLFHYFSCFKLRYYFLNSFSDFHQLLYFCLNYSFDLFHFNVTNYFVYFNLLCYLFTLH